MKTIEERAKAYSLKDFDGYYTGRESAVEEGYIAGASEQKAIDEEVRLKKCDDTTEAEYDKEVAFADWYHKNGKGTPTFSDAIEWARKGMIDIDKACKWFESYLAEIGYPDDWCRDSEVQESGEKRFRKAMEELNKNRYETETLH